MLGGKTRALLGLLKRRPVAATRENPKLSAPDLIRKGLCGARRSDWIVLAGDEKSGASQGPKVGGFGGGERLARLRKAFAVLSEVALPDIGEGDWVGKLG